MNKIIKGILAGTLVLTVAIPTVYAEGDNGVKDLIDVLTTKIDNVVTSLTNTNNQVATLEQTVKQQQNMMAQQQNEIAELKKQVNDQLNMIKGEHEFGDFDLYVYDRWEGRNKPISNLEVVLVKYPFDSTYNHVFDDKYAHYTFKTDANGKIHGRLPNGDYQAYARYDKGQMGGTALHIDDKAPAGHYFEFYTWKENDPQAQQ